MSNIKKLLEELNLNQYYEKFINEGYEDLEFLKTRTLNQLNSICSYIGMKHGHIAKFIGAFYKKDPLESKTVIGMVVDRSGSMQSIVNDVIGGFNGFIQKQKEVGDAEVSVVRFDNTVEVLYQNKSIHEIPEATLDTFRPRGGTALLDAIKYTIDMVDKSVTSINNKVMIVILTDGEENSSTSISREKLFRIIQNRENEKQWEFLFLSANKDAIKAGTSMGMKAKNCMDWSKDKTPQVFESATNYCSRMRTNNIRSFTDEERGICK